MTDITEPGISADFAALLQSEHVTERTRRIMMERAALPEGRPQVLAPEAMICLRALVDYVLPQSGIFGEEQIDIASRIDARLTGPGDGWRFAILPTDAIAYAKALETLDAAAHTLHGRPFAALVALEAIALLETMEDGLLESGPLSSAQMQRWFSDLRADTVQIFMAHPAVQGRLGISAIATGGDATIDGFSQIGTDQKDGWEPAPPLEEHN